MTLEVLFCAMENIEEQRVGYNYSCIKLLETILHKYPQLRLEQLLFNLDEGQDFFYEEPKMTSVRWANKLKELENQDIQKA